MIRVDANRDGAISFADNTDQTTPSTPFPFWIDNQHAVITDTSTGTQYDTDPSLGPADSVANKILFTRDLDNFLRVQIQAPAGFDPTDPSWTCTMTFTQVVAGSPVVRIFPAVTSDLKYLKEPSVASAQVLKPELTPVADNYESPIPTSVFANSSNTAALLFDVVTPGQGALTVRMYKNNVKVGEDYVYLDLKPVSKMYDHWTVGNTTVPATVWPNSQPTQIGFADPVVGQTSDYIVFVHGWRVLDWEKRVFAETAFKRLWHSGYKGGFALFSWPTEWKPDGKLAALTDRQNYDRSENKAWVSATGLHELLVKLQADHPGHVSMFAHSMGNIVASEALRIEAETTTPTKLVHVYVASQAASVANAYDQSVPRIQIRADKDVYGYFSPTGKPYFAGTLDTSPTGGLRRAADDLVNFYNESDFALATTAWGVNQILKPDSGWTYDTGFVHVGGTRNTPGYYRFGPPKVLLDYQADRYEIFSYAAPAYTSALGATANVGGQFTKEEQVNLNASPFNFGGLEANSHSAQFLDTMAKRTAYWQQLLHTFGIQ